MRKAHVCGVLQVLRGRAKVRLFPFGVDIAQAGKLKGELGVSDVCAHDKYPYKPRLLRDVRVAGRPRVMMQCNIIVARAQV